MKRNADRLPARESKPEFEHSQDSDQNAGERGRVPSSLQGVEEDGTSNFALRQQPVQFLPLARQSLR